MLTDNRQTCLIWRATYDANWMRIPTTDSFRVDSWRAGGKYTISQVVEEDEVRNLSPDEKARLTTWLIDQRLLGVESPEVTKEIVEFTLQRSPLTDDQRADRLLRFLVTQSERAGDQIPLLLSDYVAEKIRKHGAINVNENAVLALKRSYGAAAWSESTQCSEIQHLLDHLRSNEWLVAEERSSEIWRNFRASQDVVTVTVAGRSRVQNEATSADSAQGFVAMWLDVSVGDAYQNGIRRAIEQAGYSPLLITEKPDIDKIDDDIMAEIRKSHFVVADVTHGDDGARGSVYFEAGFAFGLGVPVIFTCRTDMRRKLHFDTRQYAHIFWKTHNMRKFRTELEERIVERFGQGPGAGSGRGLT